MLAGLFPRPSPKHGPNLSVFPKADTTPVTDLIDHAADLPLAPPGPEVLVIAAHSQLEHARINRRLMRAAAGGAATLEVRDLYAPYPDDLIDTKAEQALLKSARLVVVWQDPIHRYSMPPLTKRWVGEMLAFGWAGPGRAGPGGTALRGKDLWRVATTGGPEQPYHPDRHLRYFFDAFLPPCAQTAALCGMRFLPPRLLHGAHRASEAGVAAHVGVCTQRRASHANRPELDDLRYGLACAVPQDARPDGEPTAPTGRGAGPLRRPRTRP